MLTWTDLTERLADEIATHLPLADEWRQAFVQVPRHLFVPRFENADGTSVSGEDPTQHDRWLDAVYSDIALTTQTLALPDSGLRVPTSSSTAPVLMARMLGLLDVTTGNTVLEIGTGTGYNAALLAHRLGSDAVTTIDIDDVLVRMAKERLAQLDLFPTLVVGDGAAGVVERAPYDRIIATCAVTAIPSEWIAQLTEHGLIVADMRLATSGALVSVRHDRDGLAIGRFHAEPSRFMWLRPNRGDPLRHPEEGNRLYDQRGARFGTTDHDPALLDDPEFGFVLGLLVPGIVKAAAFVDPEARALRAADGSWTRVDSGSRAVLQAGPRSLWDEVAAAIRWWDSHGRPARERFGLTATSRGQQTVWLDDTRHPVEPIKGSHTQG